MTTPYGDRSPSPHPYSNSNKRPLAALQQKENDTSRQGLGRRSAPPKPVTALALLRQSLATPRFYLMRHETSKPPPMWLRLMPGKITELVGPASSGKSQTALSVCLHAAKSNHQALYLSLKGTVALTKMLQRLHQMSSSQPELLQRILTRSVVQTDDFWDLLQTELPALLQSQNIRVVVLDSLADLFRGQFMKAQNLNVTRSAWLLCAASQLLRCASQYGVAVVVLNQVSFGDKIPALGLTWKHCVQESFLLSRQGSCRSVSLLKSSTSRCGQRLEFEIGAEGVVLKDPGATTTSTLAGARVLTQNAR